MEFKFRLVRHARDLGHNSDRFDVVNINHYPDIIKKIEATFFVKQATDISPAWLAGDLKDKQYSLQFEWDDAPDYLHYMIPTDEKVYFAACMEDITTAKYWLMEGYIDVIQAITGQLPFFKYYIVSKRYEWLLTEDDAGNLIGMGSMIDGLKQFASRHKL